MSQNYHEKQLILIVDDTPMNLMVLGNTLKNASYKIAFARNGEDALLYVEKNKPDLILLDIMMPDMDGYEVCKRLKNDNQTNQIPIIFITARSDLESIVKGFDIGASDYITKPFNSKEVQIRVENQLKIKLLTESLLEKNKVLNEKQEIINRDLEAALIIQRSLVSPPFTRLHNIIVATCFLPGSKVGGDILNYILLDDRHVAFFILDVMGHGVASAMLSLLVSQLLIKNDYSFLMENNHYLPPKVVLEKLDQEFPFERFERFFSIFYMVLDLTGGEIEYANAGHPMPMILRQNRSIEILENSGAIIGIGEIQTFQNCKAFLKPNDKIFLFSDGILEETDHKGRFFGQERLQNQILKSMDQPIQHICDDIMDSIKQFNDNQKFKDDISLMGIEYTTMKQSTLPPKMK